MQYLPKIEAVRDKGAEIPIELIEPGSKGAFFPGLVGPRVVYLDQRYDYPPQPGNNIRLEIDRQNALWGQFQEDGGCRFLDRQAEEDFHPRVLQQVQQRVREELGHRNSAEYFERVWSTLFEEKMNVVIMSTGVTSFEAKSYHDIGYFAE